MQLTLDLQTPSFSDSCAVPKEARDIVQHCNDFYSFDEEDKSPFNSPGWRPFSASVDWTNFTDLCPAPWNYMSQEQTQSSPSWGFFNIYDGGGYVADLGYSIATAAPVISNLHKYRWIDRQTRAVLLEFVIYNANTGYLSISTFVNEILPTGYGNAFAKIDTFPLTSTATGFYQFYLICQLLFIIIVILFVLREMYKIYKMRCGYFRNLWNWVEILQITFSFLVVIFFVIKSKFVLKSALKVKENPYVPVSFGDAVYWNDAENGVLAIAVFIVTVKLLRMIRINPYISILMSSFRKSVRLLLSYSVILTIIFLAYAQLGMLIMNNNMQRFSSFQNALFSLFLMCLGAKMGLSDLLQVNRILGPLFGFSFIFINTFIFINFFVAILNDSYEDAKDNTDKQSNEFKMADFILERLRELLGCGKKQEENSVGNDSERQEPNKKPKISLSTIAFQSHQRRRGVRKIQLKNSRMLRKNASKGKYLQRVKFKELTAKTRRPRLKLAASGSMALNGLNQESMLTRLDLLTSKVVRDDEREEMELLSLLRLLGVSHSKDTEEATSEAMMDDIAISPFITASSLTMTTACVDDTRSRTPGYHALDLFKHRASCRGLQQNLRGKQPQDQLRSAAAEDTEEASFEAMMDDIVISSFITASPLTMATACVDDTRSRTPGYHALDLFRSRASCRGLPQHLRGKQLHDQLRSAGAENNN